MKVSVFVNALRKAADPIDYETDDTRGGCTVRKTWYSRDRYFIDYAPDFKSEGWLQFDTDQDAEYFGVWVNPMQFLTLTYCEGDVILVECHDRERYLRCIQRMIDFYGEGEIARAIDAYTTTVYRQDRSEFLNVPEQQGE